MEVHLIGHASFLVKSQDCTILIDPLLKQGHPDGWFELVPRRMVECDRLPSIDLLVITSAQPDHFDPSTLALLPTTIPVLFPPHAPLGAYLRELGYTLLYPLRPCTEVTFGGTTLMNTCSKGSRDSFGLVLADASGVCWYPAVRPVQPDVLLAVQDRFHGIDCLLMPWQSIASTQVEHQTDFLRAYNQWFDDIRLIQPRTMALVANGLRSPQPPAHPNQSPLPIRRDRFYQDLKHAAPYVKAGFWLEPGDVLHIESQSVQKQSAACEFIRPVGGQMSLPMPEQGKESDVETPLSSDMRDIIHQDIREQWPVFIRDHQQTRLQNHVRWQVIYQLMVQFPDALETWHFDFSQASVQSQPGPHPLATAFTTITAACYYNLLQQLTTTQAATWTTAYQYQQYIYQLTPTGIVTPDQFTQVVDPLFLRMSTQHDHVATLQQCQNANSTRVPIASIQTSGGRTATRPGPYRLTFHVSE